MRKKFLAHTFATVNVRNEMTQQSEMIDFSQNVPESRGFFPKVTTSEEQQDFVYEKLLPKMKSEGLVRHETWSEFVRAAIDSAAAKVGVDPVRLEMKSPGRKKKQRVEAD